MVTANQKHTTDSQKPKRTQAYNRRSSSNHKRKKKKRRNEQIRTTKTTGNRFKMAISTRSSITALNISGLNVPIKKHRMSDWIKKQEPIICCLQETQCRGKTHKDLN